MTDSPDDVAYRERVIGRIDATLARGSTRFLDVLAACDGADPRIVFALWKDRQKASSPTGAVRFREISGLLPWHLPAADPHLAQWWFTLDAIDYIAEQVVSSRSRVSNSRVFCLGAPTIGLRLHTMGVTTGLFDVDRDVLDAATKAAGTAGESLQTTTFDAADELPEAHRAKYTAAVLDPPWYTPITWTFLQRAFEAVERGGDVFLSLPPLLTRPTAEHEREELISGLVLAGAAFVKLETGVLKYVVPRFEEAALLDLDGFTGRPWRSGDLLHVRRRAGKLGNAGPPAAKTVFESFSRRPTEFRVFLRGTATAKQLVNIERLEKYSTNISTRAAGEVPDVWTTEKVGAHIDDVDSARTIIGAWQTGASQDHAAVALAKQCGIELEAARKRVREYESVLRLWSHYADGTPRRSSEEIDRQRREFYSPWGAEPSERSHSTDSDGYRPEFQRDRDRIIWSSGLRRLSHKTQLFPVASDDELRHRLAHSIEVMQLALTLASNFGLNEELVQAGALAHDIGHTPFGHAGEHALDRLFRKLHPRLPGFNHYEHGVDVVRYLEGAYASSRAGGYHGLNLTPEVVECIIKHTYCQFGNVSSSYEAVARDSKYGDIPSGFCHLEGQAVRLADKFSYLISDLEDGIRLGVIRDEDVRQCRLFYRAPIDLAQRSRQPLAERFREQRPNLIRVLMEDAIRETGRRLHRCANKSAVRALSDYTVANSSEIQNDMNEVWTRIQSGRLHLDQRVVAANMRAARIVSELTLLLALFPEFVEPAFVAEYERLRGTPYDDFYRKRTAGAVVARSELLRFLPLDLTIGAKYPSPDPTIDHFDLIRAKDYVAALTDARARELHARFVSSG